jgi:hypothetical protein
MTPLPDSPKHYLLSKLLTYIKIEKTEDIRVY